MDNRQDELARFRESLDVPRQTNRPVDSFYKISRAWLDAITRACVISAYCSRDEFPITIFDAVGVLSEAYEPRVEEAYNRLLGVDAKHPRLGILETATAIWSGLGALGRKATADCLDLRGPSYDQIRSNLFSQIELLNRHAHIGQTIILTDTERPLWDLLDGQILMGHELAKQLDRSEDAVKKCIRRINAKGALIENEKCCGYYRPDALPAEAIVT